jgi:hypothetical protein
MARREQVVSFAANSSVGASSPCSLLSIYVLNQNMLRTCELWGHCELVIQAVKVKNGGASSSMANI